MRRYERIVSVVRAQQFKPPEDGEVTIFNDGTTIKESKKYDWWITQHHSFDPNTDEYRGTSYQLLHPSMIGGILPNDWIIWENGRVSRMSDEDFRKKYRAVK